MNSKDEEAEQLRKQIQFLESLITSAKGNKSGANTSSWKSATGSLQKPYTDSKFKSQNFKLQLGSAPNKPTTNARYSWTKTELGGKDTGHLASQRNTYRTKGPYSTPVTETSSDAFAFRKHQSYKQREPAISFVNTGSHNKNVVNLPESGRRPDPGYTDKLSQLSKDKSLFTWKKNLYADRSNEHLFTKDKLAVVKSNKLPDQTRPSAGEHKPNAAVRKNDNELRKSDMPKPKYDKGGGNISNAAQNVPKVTHSTYVENRNSSKCTESGARSTSSGHENTTTSTSSKHSSLRSELLIAQTSLEEWKRRLLEKKQSIQSQSHKPHNSLSKKSKLALQGKHRTTKYSHSSISFQKPGYSQYVRQPWNRGSYRGRQKGKHGAHWKSHNDYGGVNRWTSNRGSYKHVGRWKYPYGFEGKGTRLMKHSGYYTKNSPVMSFNSTFRRKPIVSRAYLKKRIARLEKLINKVPFNPRLKLDRRKPEDNTKRLRFVVINGMLYKTSQKSLVRASGKPCTHSTSPHSKSGGHEDGAQSRVRFLNTTAMKTVIVRGVKFKVDRDGKSLKRMETRQETGTISKRGTKEGRCISRVDIGGVTYRQTKPGTLEKVTTRKNKVIARRVLQRTVAQAASRHKKDNTKSTSQYCMFYNRFGKCNRGDKCPYIHDPDRIAVCTRFLRGTCKVKKCPFSHKVSVEKLPVCSFFLKGVCNKPDCPYPHVNVNKDAEICKDFVSGYCSLGKECKKKHTLLCPVFMKTGECPNGTKCQLQHRKQKRRKSSGSSKTPKEENQPSGSTKDQGPAISEVCDTHLPFKERRLPAYIPIKYKSADVVITGESKPGTSNNPTEVATSSIRIRPQL